MVGTLSRPHFEGFASPGSAPYGCTASLSTRWRGTDVALRRNIRQRPTPRNLAPYFGTHPLNFRGFDISTLLCYGCRRCTFAFTY